MRTTPEKKEEKERVRSALLQATLKLAAAHSFGSLGLREVAREAGIAPTSFYRHFTDMDELGRALIEEVLGALFREFETQITAAATENRDVATALLEAGVVAIDREPEVVRFLLTEQAGAFAAFRASLRERIEALAQSLHRAAGAQSSLRLARTAILVLLDGLNRTLDLNRDDAQARAALALDLLENLRFHLSSTTGNKP